MVGAAEFALIKRKPGAFIPAEIEKCAQVVKDAGIVPE